MKTIACSLSVVLFLAVGCGGTLDDLGRAGGEGTVAGGKGENGEAGVGWRQFSMTASGECALPDGSACLFNVPEPPPDETTPPANPPDGTEPPPTITVPPTTATPPEDGGCWVTGIGTFGKGDTRDSFGGNAMTMKAGTVRGEWQHTDHFDQSGTQKNGQNLFHGKVTYIVCKRYPTLPGPEVPKAEPNYANWGGVGRYNGVDGYFFDVKAFDHAEGGIHKDRYVIEIYGPDKQLVLHADGLGTLADPSNKECEVDPAVTPDLAWVKAMGCLSGGNFQIHPPNKGHPY